MPWPFLFFLLIAASHCATAPATTLAPMSEDEQIRGSTTIFRGRAEQVGAAREPTAGGTAIVTTVRFARLATYKGAPPASVSLRFLGGKVGDVEMKVDGMPQFLTGQEYILFVAEGKNRACPVVGWSEGSLRVDRGVAAAGEVIIPTRNSAPIAKAGGQARSRRAASGNAALPEFERRLRGRISELSAQP